MEDWVARTTALWAVANWTPESDVHKPSPELMVRAESTWRSLQGGTESAVSHCGRGQEGVGVQPRSSLSLPFLSVGGWSLKVPIRADAAWSPSALVQPRPWKCGEATPPTGQAVQAEDRGPSSPGHVSGSGVRWFWMGSFLR